MSELPGKWLDVDLSEVADIIRGVTYKREQAADVPHEGFVPVLRATNITGAALTFDGLVYVPNSNVSDEQLLQPGDVVIASSSGSKEIVGKAGAFAGGDFIGSFGAFCTGIRPSSALSAAYFGYYFQTPSYRKSVSELSAGSNINNLKIGDLASQRFPLPSTPEQTRIVAKLEELLSDLDAGVAELKTAQKKLAQYRQSLLKAAVEGALTAEWRAKRQTTLEPSFPRTRESSPDHQTPLDSRVRGNDESETGAQLLARILTERRARWEAKQLAKFKEQGKPAPRDWQKKYPEPVQPDTTDLPQLPEGWVWASLDQVVSESLLGLDRGQELQSKTSGNVAYLKMNNLSMNGEIETKGLVRINASDTEIERYLLRVDDVLFNTRNSKELVGKTGRVTQQMEPTVFNNNLMRLRFDGAAIPAFVCFQMVGPEFRTRMETIKKATTSVAAVYAKDLFPLAVALPSYAEQAEIVACLEQALAGIADMERAIARQSQQSTAQRQNLLRAAFAGQLVPQDPNDEPASELLARIRAERAARNAVKMPHGRRQLHKD